MNTWILIIQIGTAIGYIGGLFYIYRVLVDSKDATIESLKERVGFLEQQLKTAQEMSPDIVAERLSRRIAITESELARLSEDAENNSEQITQLSCQLEEARKIADEFEEKLEEAKDVLNELSCPHCGSIMSTRDYHPITYEDMEGDVEVITYECGLYLIDGREHSPCRFNKKSVDNQK